MFESPMKKSHLGMDPTGAVGFIKETQAWPICPIAQKLWPFEISVQKFMESPVVNEGVMNTVTKNAQNLQKI